MQVMAAVKEWLSTKEVCSGDGGHSRKDDGCSERVIAGGRSVQH